MTFLLFSTLALMGADPTDELQPRVLAQQPIQSLELERAVERSIAGGEKHAYRVVVAADQFLQIVLDQRGIDLAVALLTSDGKDLVVADSRSAAQGPESLSYVAQQTGELRVEIRAGDDRTVRGRYEIKVTALRTATRTRAQRSQPCETRTLCLVSATRQSADKVLKERR